MSSIRGSFCSSIECPHCSFNKYDISYPCPNCGFEYCLQKNKKKYKKGDKIDNRYEVHDVKEGGMGTVYICYDHDWKAPVAIKTILPEYFEDHQRRNLFKNEAENWIRLEKHINIVNAKYIEDVDYFPHIFMELITNNEGYGVDLQSWIEKNYQFTIEEILRYSMQFCDGMLHAKQKFIIIGKVFVHRDIKPSNILINEDKIVKITDFGMVGGTRGYRSPEQLNNEILDERSDIYSFGLVMKEMFSSKKSTFITSLEEKLEATIKKCFEYNKEDRVASFVDLRTLLEEQYYELTGKSFQKIDGEDLKIVELINHGTSLGYLGKHEEALKCFDSILKIKPVVNFLSFQKASWDQTIVNNQVNIWYNKGEALRNIGKLKEAMDCFDKALQIDNSHARIWNSKGIVLHELGDLDKALECYETTLKINPQDFIALSNKGKIFKDQGKLDEAIVFYDAALRINQKHLETLNNKGNILHLLRRDEEAINYFDKALNINPEHIDAWLSKGAILELLGDHKNAIICYDKIIEFNPKYWKGFFNKAISEYSIGRLDKSHEYFEKAITYLESDLQSNPNISEILHHKGIALFHLNRISDAIKCFEKVIKINPNHKDAQLVLHAIKVASEIYEGLHEQISIGVSLYTQCRYEEAIQNFDKVLEVLPHCKDDLFILIYLNPLFQQALGNKAVTLAKLGKHNDAIEYFNKLLKLNPNSPEGWFGKGSSLLMLEQHEEAIKCYDKALENSLEDNSKKADIWYYKGVALKILGYEREANKCFDSVTRFESTRMNT